MKRWNLQKLGHFVVVAAAPSLSEAARQIGISQPALTTSMRTLESELGFTLFDRNKGFELTAMGRELLPRAKAALNRIDDLEREVEMVLAGDAGELRVACGPAVADGLVGIAIAGLMKASPAARIRVDVVGYTSFEAMLRDRQVDLVVGDTSPFLDRDGFEVVPLKPQEIVFFCRSGHPLATRESVGIDEFFGFPLVAPDLGPQATQWLAALRPAKDALRSLTLTCSHLALLKRVVESSDAISGAPRMVIQPGLDAGRLAVIDLVARPMLNHIGVIHLKARSLGPVAERLVEELKAVSGRGR
ncbi:LysR family transcriptional regulator [Luteolibacter marinus]|uniref:LysR family transcriptional regulator n=1 Tax=Luteolibacter marinus TaxID=2776705 RepID=UPI001865ECF8|nr:LysR family transcriptional regulator [Luteolibacter marinus]